ncbi:hypothetical protein, partial [Aeromonas hydrophila]
MSARRSLTRGIGEQLRLLDPGLSDLVRTPQLFHSTTPLARMTTNYLSIFGHLRSTGFVDGFVRGFWL